MTNEKEALILSVYERHDDLVRQYNNLKSKFFVFQRGDTLTLTPDFVRDRRMRGLLLRFRRRSWEPEMRSCTPFTEVLPLGSFCARFLIIDHSACTSVFTGAFC